MSLEQKVHVEGVLYNEENEILVVQNNEYSTFAGVWDLPSRRVGIGDNPSRVLEESFQSTTGLEVETERPLRVREHVNVGEHNVVVAYELESAEGDYENIDIGQGYQDHNWIAEDDLEEYSFMEFVEEDLEKAFEEL